MAKISKRKQAANEIDRTRSYPLAEAVSMIKASAAASKFDETIEIAMNLGVLYFEIKKDIDSALAVGEDTLNEMLDAYLKAKE